MTNDDDSSALALKSEHRHKADIESSMRELKSNFGLHAFRKHGLMANWAWLLLVCLATTCAGGRSSWDVSEPGGAVRICAPSVSVIATPSRPWWCAAVGDSRRAFRPLTLTSSSSRRPTNALRPSGPLPPDQTPSARGGRSLTPHAPLRHDVEPDPSRDPKRLGRQVAHLRRILPTSESQESASEFSHH